jgi:hypothetical protein
MTFERADQNAAIESRDPGAAKRGRKPRISGVRVTAEMKELAARCR